MHACLHTSRLSSQPVSEGGNYLNIFLTVSLQRQRYGLARLRQAKLGLLLLLLLLWGVSYVGLADRPGWLVG